MEDSAHRTLWLARKTRSLAPAVSVLLSALSLLLLISLLWYNIVHWCIGGKERCRVAVRDVGHQHSDEPWKMPIQIDESWISLKLGLILRWCFNASAVLWHRLGIRLVDNLTHYLYVVCHCRQHWGPEEDLRSSMRWDQGRRIRENRDSPSFVHSLSESFRCHVISICL